MKIVAGAFGLSGKAKLAGPVLQLRGQKHAEYRRHDIRSVTVRSQSITGFGLIGCFIGMVVLGAIGLAMLGLLGAVIGIVLAIAGSFYSSNKHLAELAFMDGKAVTLEGSRREIERVVNFPG